MFPLAAVQGSKFFAARGLRKGSSMTGNSKRALVVDDNPTHRDLFGAILATQGLSVHYAENGDQAVMIAKALAFDLILMDVNMPIMDGLEATALIRADERSTARGRCRLFVVTTCDEEAIRDRARQAGADGYLGKPIDFAKLVGLAQTAVEPLAADLHPQAARSGR